MIHFDSDGDNTAQAMKAGPGRIVHLHVANPNAAEADYIQLFDVASGSVTVGTTAPTQSYLIPAAEELDIVFPSVGLVMETAITYACTTTATGSTDPTIGLVVNAIYE